MLIDSESGDGSQSWVVIIRGLERYDTAFSATCKQYMFTETATQQDTSSSIEKSVANVASATRSNRKSPLASISVSGSPQAKLHLAPLMGKVSSLFRLKECNPLSLRGEIPCVNRQYHQSRKSGKGCSDRRNPNQKAVPLRIPQKDMPYRQAIYAKAPPEAPLVLEIDGSGDISLIWEIPQENQSTLLREWWKY